MNLIKTLSLLSILLVLSCFLPSEAYTATSSFKVSPLVTKLRVDGQESLKVPVTIENLTDEVLDLTTSFQPFTLDSKTKSLRFLDKNDPEYESYATLVKKLVFPEEAILLAPHEKKTIEIGINIDKSLSKNDYTFSIVLKTKNPNNQLSPMEGKTQLRTAVQAAIASHVLLSLKKPQTEKVTLHAFLFPPITTKIPLNTSIAINNSGDSFAVISGSLVIRNILNQAVETFLIPETTVLSKTTRNLSLIREEPHTSENQLVKSEGNSVLALPSFGLGYYTATLTLSPNNLSLLQEKRSILVIDVKMIVILLGIIISSVWLIRRITRRLRLENS